MAHIILWSLFRRCEWPARATEVPLVEPTLYHCTVRTRTYQRLRGPQSRQSRYPLPRAIRRLTSSSTGLVPTISNTSSAANGGGKSGDLMVSTPSGSPSTSTSAMMVLPRTRSSQRQRSTLRAWSISKVSWRVLTLHGLLTVLNARFSYSYMSTGVRSARISELCVAH